MAALDCQRVAVAMLFSGACVDQQRLRWLSCFGMAALSSFCSEGLGALHGRGVVGDSQDNDGRFRYPKHHDALTSLTTDI